MVCKKAPPSVNPWIGFRRMRGKGGRGGRSEKKKSPRKLQSNMQGFKAQRNPQERNRTYSERRAPTRERIR